MLRWSFLTMVVLPRRLACECVVASWPVLAEGQLDPQ